MSKRTFQQRENTPSSAEYSEVLLTSEPVAVYYRQSTIAQVGNNSTAIQTIDMVDELVRRGWQRDNIILIDTDEGVSGTKRIDEREGMSYLFELIADRKIGALACQDEDRLFRDWTQIQVNIFLDACRKSKVKVITPSFVYDFAHPLYGEFHARQFRFKCEMAAEYIKSYILGRLTPAKMRMAREGFWVGGRIPVGYMVDVRKRLPDGAENPNWRKFVPFEPYAAIVREYFRIFVENGGAIRKTIRQIQHDRVSFPDCTPPDGFKINYKLKWRGNGYYLNRPCTVLLLTNPMYLGHRLIDGAISNWNNHEPLVDAHLFMNAFNYLSKFTLSGEENPNYHPAYQFSRPELDEKRGVERPLCEGLLHSQIGETWYRAGVNFNTRNKCWLYILNRSENDGTHNEWTRRAEWIDSALIGHCKLKLQSTFKSDEWMQTIKDTDQITERERKVKRLALAALNEEKQNLMLSLRTLTLAPLIQEVEARYKQVEKEKERLTAELARLEQKRQCHVSVEQAATLFQRAATDWNSLTPEECRAVLKQCITRVEVSDYNRSGGMRLLIRWNGGAVEEMQLWHKSKAAHWTIENSERVLALFDKGASQLEIAAAFPNLKWAQLFNEIKKHRGLIRFSPIYLGKQETHADYIARGGGKGKCTSSYWRPEEDEQLCQMVKNGATQEEIMQVFHFRRWIQIQYRIKTLLGKGIRIKKSGIRQNQSYDEYLLHAKTPNLDACCL